MLDINAKIKELLQKHPDPRDGEGGRCSFDRMLYLMKCPPVVGVVADNRDPECLGRIRIHYVYGTAENVSPWLCIIGQDRGNKSGMWMLPEPGTQALVVFTSADRSSGYVLGFFYDRQHRPPERENGKISGTTLLQTCSHRIEITGGEGSEKILIASAKGKIRIRIGKSEGIKLVNELGGIKIKCRTLMVKAGEEIHLASKKTFFFNVNDTLEINTDNGSDITSDGKAKLSGKNINLSGTKGVTAQGRQVASKDDRVAGFDTHIMIVPSGTGTASVPLPQPFIGKISSCVSGNVKIKGRGVAFKGSKAKHIDPMHMQLPGTIKFQNTPGKEGEVTGGTSDNVKINGREVAVTGSLVTTCNDVGAQDNSMIISPYASFPMPLIVNPLDTEKYNLEKNEIEEKKKFLGLRWEKSSIREGEEVTMTASVQNIADGNMVTMQVFFEGQGPENGIPLAKFHLILKNGSVSTKWLYKADQTELPPENDLAFVFTAHCAWCSFAKSKNVLKVNLIRPEITKTEWRDKDGNIVSTGLAGEPVELYAETKNIDGCVTFHVYDENKHEIFSKDAKVADGRAAVEWTYRWNGVKLTVRPKFTFAVTAHRCKKAESGKCEMGMKIDIKIVTETGQLFTNLVIKNKNTSEEFSLPNGSYKKEFEIPSDLDFILVNKYKNVGFGEYISLIEENILYKRMNYSDILNSGFTVYCGQPVVILIERERGIS